MHPSLLEDGDLRALQFVASRVPQTTTAVPINNAAEGSTRTDRPVWRYEGAVGFEQFG
jgi:hypothetical protein